MASGALGLRAWQQVAALEADAAVCDALRAGDLATAAAQTPSGDTGRSCRALALFALGETEVAAAEAAALDRDGVPLPPPLAIALLHTRQREGHAAAAADLARRAAAAAPTHPELMLQELQLRLAVEPEGQVLDDLGARVDAGTGLRRLLVADAWNDRFEPHKALALLGAEPSGIPPERIGLWYRARLQAQVWANDVPGARATASAWREAGEDPRVVAAFYAIGVSQGLQDPDPGPVALLAAAAPASEALGRPDLSAYLYTRWIGHLVNTGATDAALAVYDGLGGRLELPSISRQAIERLEVTLDEDTGPTVGLRFLVPGAGQVLLAGDTLDAPWVAHAVGGPTVVEVPWTPLPQRWVFRDGSGVRASGTLWPPRTGVVDVDVTARAPAPEQRFARTGRAGDGRRKLLTVILDCADWRLAGYLRARGELPVLDAMIAVGWSGVLRSDPPFTAAAMRALVYPQTDRQVTTASHLHELGMELAGLADVGVNPFDALGAVLPFTPDLFGTLGAGELSAGNMLFSHGAVEAGRHAELVGPGGRRSTLPALAAERPLTATEAERFEPWLGSVGDRYTEGHVRLIASELDALTTFATSETPDVMVLRVEPLDLLTHALYSDTSEVGQDDGQKLLYEVYRYVDERLGEVWNALDDDDVLLIVSDHGIRVAMQHDPAALLVAVGDGVPHGRAEGEPAFTGLARAVADLAGVPTDWPATGVAPWAE